MDPFTENILARARERQKIIQTLSESNKIVSEPNLSDVVALGKKDVASDSNIVLKCNKLDKCCKENLSEGNLPKMLRQNSRTRVSSDIPGSPQTQLKTLNIQRDNFNMEIKLSSAENVRVQVEIEEQSESEGSDDSDAESLPSDGLREDAKNRLKRLGQLYSGDTDISSPIHRTEENFCQNDSSPVKTVSKSSPVKGRKGLSKLADLAKTINQWEDETTAKMETKVTSPRKAWKAPAPQPPSSPAKSTPSKSSGKPKAPEPPTVASPIRNSTTQIVGMTPKQLKWDKNVLDTLESQGFTRTDSKARLVYDYESQNKEEKTAEIEKEPEPVKQPEILKTPTKRTNTIAEKAARFESASPGGRTPTKDPALLSVSERKALFEKNKGTALVPKAPFAMAAPAKPEIASKKPEAASKKLEVASKAVSKQIENVKPKSKTPPKHNKPLAPKPPVSSQPTVAAVTQAGGIASKMAALLEGKTTISQSQIENSTREARQKEMDMLLNRYQKNKQIDDDAIDELESDEEEEHNIDEKTAMLSGKHPKIVSQKPVPPPMPPVPPPEKRKSVGKRCSNSDSPKVAAVLDEVKRIKVSPPKAGRLYPNLSDIEVTTETETENPSANNSSFEDNAAYDSDDPNTSFGRDIMEAVCKNQTPQKRQIYDESTASDLSSILDDMDDSYLDDIDTSSGPTPPKLGRKTPPSALKAESSSSFHYKNCNPTKVQFKSPIASKGSPKKSMDLPSYVVEGDNVLPLTHTVSFYRKQQSQSNNTPVKQISRQPLIEEAPSKGSSSDDEAIQKKITSLNEEVNKQQMIISQTSQALNLCYRTPEFSGSTEQVEAEKVLLVASHRRQALMHELQRLKVEGTIRPKTEHAQNLPLEKGTLTISKIILPLKKKYVTALAAAGGKGHHVVCLIKCGEQVVPTKLVSTVANKTKDPDVDLYIPGKITLNDIYSDFTVTFEVYCLQAQEEFLPHEVKYHINKKPGSKLTPKKGKHDSRLIMPLKESPAGPQAVRTPSFALMGYVVFSVQAVSKTSWTLNNTPSMSPLEGNVEMTIKCALAVSVEHRGFLTMFEDVSGFGAWHRRWCLLKGHTISYWKYPDDERRTPPIDTIDLNNCITKQVGPVSREICARLHTFLLERERRAYPQDKDTLVMVCKGDKTVIRHLLSADTKEERVQWCSEINAALTAMRMWGNSQ